MKKVVLRDRYGTKNIIMCEKHFKIYRDYLGGAAAGGTTYTFDDTNKRGCHLCRGKNENR